MSGKVLLLNELAPRAKELRDAGKKLVATNGCFDLLHVGHVHYLQAARARGDVLIVGINGDRSVCELKGPGRPINKERDRAEVLAALECVDLIAIFHEVRALSFIQPAMPHIYVKGGDYTPDTLDPDERALLERIGAKIEIVPFEKGYSTSRLIAQLRAAEK
jgi:rfaE bifunctional protein nucleotidyltransferase chain/domain